MGARVRYLATTVARSPPAGMVVMVDGTVPGWLLRADDWHFDHHRLGGAPIQLSEIDATAAATIRTLVGEHGALFVTTLADADACAAAAFCQIAPGRNDHRRLEAIAYDCDHLHVPASHADLAGFAFQAVATLKLMSSRVRSELGLSGPRAQWSGDDRERHGSEMFRRGSEWLVAAIRGERPWPGASGEADDYAGMIRQSALALCRDRRVYAYRDIPVADCRGYSQRIDPRACLQAWQNTGAIGARAETLSIYDHKHGGVAYTLGCIPWHSARPALNYLDAVFESLTGLERTLNPEAGTWGGRRTVGGSPWNTPSALTPRQVIDTMLDARAPDRRERR